EKELVDGAQEQRRIERPALHDIGVEAVRVEQAEARCADRAHREAADGAVGGVKRRRRRRRRRLLGAAGCRDEEEQEERERPHDAAAPYLKHPEGTNPPGFIAKNSQRLRSRERWPPVA